MYQGYWATRLVGKAEKATLPLGAPVGGQVRKSSPWVTWWARPQRVQNVQNEQSAAWPQPVLLTPSAYSRGHRFPRVYFSGLALGFGSLTSDPFRTLPVLHAHLSVRAQGGQIADFTAAWVVLPRDCWVVRPEGQHVTPSRPRRHRRRECGENVRTRGVKGCECGLLDRTRLWNSGTHTCWDYPSEVEPVSN